MGPKAWGIVVLVLLASPCAGDDPYNVTLTIGWGNYYRPMEWTPADVTIIYNMEKPFGGVLRMSAQQDSLTVLNVIQPITLQKGLPLYVPLATKLAPGASTCDLSIADHRGRDRWSYSYDLQSIFGGVRGQTAVEVNDLLIGSAGKSGAGLRQLETETRSSTAGEQGRVYVGSRFPKHLPWDWTGYASLDLLVLYDVDWSGINAQQARAIAQWVSNGGRALIVLGATHPLPKTGPLAAMVPLSIGDSNLVTIRARDLPQEASRSPVIQGEPNAVAAWGLGEPNRPGWTREKLGPHEVLAHGPAGFGRVAVLAFDPDELRLSSSRNTSGSTSGNTDLWVWCVKDLLGTRKIEPGQPSSDSGNTGYGYTRYRPGQSSQATNAVLEHLLKIPELRPLSIWWVIGLLTLLAVLLGPVDYLVLKRLDRLPWTWITSTALIALFTVGAYYGVQALRAGSTQVRSVTVTDGIEGGPAWSTSYSGIFASGSDEYGLEGLLPNQWWSGLAPTRDEYGYGSRSEEFSTRKITCLQKDGANLPLPLPISIWSMQCLLTEGPVEQMPFSADVTVRGGKVIVDVVNRSAGTVRTAWLRHWDRQALLGPVPAKGTAHFEAELGGRGSPIETGEESSSTPGEHEVALGSGAAGWACGSAGTLQRTPAIEAYLKRGAAVIYAVYEDTPSPCQVAGTAHSTNHIQLVRLVVFPKKGPS